MNYWRKKKYKYYGISIWGKTPKWFSLRKTCEISKEVVMGKKNHNFQKLQTKDGLVMKKAYFFFLINKII